VLVTGGAQGIGRACVELFAEEGARVVVGDVRPGEPVDAAGVSHEELDVTRESDWKRVVGATVAEHGRLDVLLNNAGGGRLLRADRLDLLED
jgi:NAD(P)-dependent dehydrogenase (short-subunit alcohol dehydrogenase family)